MTDRLMTAAAAAGIGLSASRAGVALVRHLDAIIADPSTETPVARRKPRWPVADGTACLLMIALAWTQPGTTIPLKTLLLCGAVWTAAWVDRACGLIPDAVVFPLLVGGLVVAPLLEPLAGPSALAGALIGSGTGLVVHYLGGRRFGWGDVKLLAAIGSWIGAPLTIEVFLAASLLRLAQLICWGGPARAPFAPPLAVTLFLAVATTPPMLR